MAANRNPINTTQISDKQLARMALGYLKLHYRYRERKGESTTQLDAKSESGLIADGYLSFPVDDEKTFIATVEATDYWHRDELRYRHTLDMLLVDSITVSMVTAVVFLGYFFVKGNISVFHLAWLSSIFLLVLAILFFAVLVFGLLWPNRRYRYIYAIEQFKKYFADDQWVIFSFDVFSNYEDKYYKELRRQCIRYGFGLLEVDAARNIKVLLAPAREDAVKNNRQVIEFKGIANITRSVNMPTLPAAIRSLPSMPALRRNGQSYFNWQSSLLRFRRTYYNQLAIISVCILLIGGLIYRESLNAPINYVDEAEYVEEQETLGKNLEEEKTREIFYFKIDSGVFVRKSEHYMSPYIVYDLEQDPIELAPPEQSTISIFEAGTFRDIPCEDYTALTLNRYVIFFTSYYKLDEAKRNAILLRNANIPVNIAWAECFFYDRPFYLIFYENFYINAERAEERVRSIAAELQKNKLFFEVGYSQMSR